MPSSEPMRILITGASGFVGQHLIAAFKALPSPPEIVAGAFGSHANLPVNIRTVTLDVTDAAQVLAVIQAERPTHLVHLAGIAAVGQAGRAARDTWDINAGGTLNVALAIREAAPGCRLLFCGSAQVYGGAFRTGQPLTENAPLDPVNFYAASKAAADLLVGQMAKEGLRAVRLRPFNHTGPGQGPQFVVPDFAKQIADIERGKQPPRMKVGNLTVRRDFLDVRDVVDAYMKVILRFDELPNGAAFNIASGNAIAVGDVLQSLLAMSAKKIEIVPNPELMRPNDMPVIAGDAQALHRAVDWTPRRSVTETLKAVLDYYRGL